MTPRLRWKREKPAIGLARIGEPALSSDLHDGVTLFAVVSPVGGTRRQPDGWYWVAGWSSGVPQKNTCDTPCATQAEAKAQAMAYVKQHLAKHKKETT